jgi:radical SAM protein with 4Fe4S-binding SPASM domain
VTRVRYERWGAWVRLGEDAPVEPLDLRGATVALDREGALAAGFDGGPRGSDAPRPSASEASDRTEALEVHVAVTSRCSAGCTGCYQGATPHGAHVDRAALERRLDALAEREVFTVAFGGGEPLLRDDLGALADAARARGLTPVVTTSGLGMTAARAHELRAFAQVNVSYDGAATDYEIVRGFDGAAHAERAIVLLVDAGVRVGVNVVLTRPTFARIEETLVRARALGAVEAQLLRYKPAGRAASLDYLARRLTPEQIDVFPSVLRRLHDALGRGPSPLSLRIDCALVCFLVGDPALASAPETLARAGIFGCEAGAALGSIGSDGARLPCSFGPPLDDHAERSLRAFAAAPPAPCAECTLRAVCRGGCRIVAGFHERGPSDHPFALAPDPECPRVRAAARS